MSEEEASSSRAASWTETIGIWKFLAVLFMGCTVVCGVTFRTSYFTITLFFGSLAIVCALCSMFANWEKEEAADSGTGIEYELATALQDMESPCDAARILEELNPKTAARVFSKMSHTFYLQDQHSPGEILAGMDPEKVKMMCSGDENGENETVQK